MSEILKDYYEQELAFLRQLGREFGERYPSVASALQLEANKCDDPHVERLLEGVAFLAGRIHMRLDEDAPELSEGLLSVAYPQYVRPIPAMAVVQMHLDADQGQLTTGLTRPAGAQVMSRGTVEGVRCKFRLGYDTTLWPLKVEDAAWVPPQGLGLRVSRGIVGGFRIRIAAQGTPAGALDIDRLRFYLHGTGSLPYLVHELLMSKADEVVVRPVDGPADAAVPGAFKPVGFEDAEGLLPHPNRSFLPYRLLQEYFAFPEKYLFVDLVGLDGVRGERWGDAFEIVVPIRAFELPDRIRALESGVRTDLFRLGCAPIVNLFEKDSVAVQLNHRRHEYPVIADPRKPEYTRVYAVDSVSAPPRGREEPIVFEPLHGNVSVPGDRGGRTIYWHTRRRENERIEDGGPDLSISFCDRHAALVHPDLHAVTVRLVCHNGELPSRLPFGSQDGDFEMPGGGPIARIVTLVKPTRPAQPSLAATGVGGRGRMWQLISQLAVNYVSLVQDGPAQIKSILRLHNANLRPGSRQQIDGVLDIQGRPGHARIDGVHGPAFVRGTRVDLHLDEEAFTGGGAYLFAAVIERFLGLSVTVNSFSQLTAHTRQRQEPLGRWPARSGRKVLL